MTRFKKTTVKTKSATKAKKAKASTFPNARQKARGWKSPKAKAAKKKAAKTPKARPMPMIPIIMSHADVVEAIEAVIQALPEERYVEGLEEMVERAQTALDARNEEDSKENVVDEDDDLDSDGGEDRNESNE